MRTPQGEYIGVDPLVGRVCTDVIVHDEYQRSVYGPYHRIGGGATAGDWTAAIVTTSCGLDLPLWDSVVHPPELLLSDPWVRFGEPPLCGECFST